jgi:hypothetical protein
VGFVNNTRRHKRTLPQYCLQFRANADLQNANALRNHVALLRLLAFLTANYFSLRVILRYAKR